MWSTAAWDIIRVAFPDGKNGSRIVLTTRNGYVAQHPDARKILYEPKLLNEEESTRLLLTKAIPEYNLFCSSNSPATLMPDLDKLKDLGKDLAAKCRGLPLAIVVLGGYLSKNTDVDEWKRLTTDRSLQDMISTEKVITAIMDLSYYDMPSHLRLCFMYATSFPEDSSIDVTKLASLWAAEGFIPMVRGHTREEIAVKNVAELVQRCMFQVEKRRKSGRITVIKLHDILRDWGIGRARREGLIKDCHSVEDAEASYRDEMAQAYRMVFHGLQANEVSGYLRHLCTVLYFNIPRREGTAWMAKIFQDLRHLRVLYLDGSGSYQLHLPKDIVQMRYLRYLGLGGRCQYRLPSSVGGLLNLETVHAAGEIDDIPSSLWRIPALRHVHVYNALGWSVPLINTKSKMNVVVIFRTYNGPRVHLSLNNIELEKVWRKLEATRRQVILEDKNPNPSCIFGMEYVLNHLYVVGRYKEGLHLPEPFWYYTGLTICCANLLNNDKHMLELGSMLRLYLLEIGEQSYTGSIMTFPRGSFINLERLALHDLPLDELKIEDGSLTGLKRLTLCNCPNLNYLPEALLLLEADLKLIAMPLGCQQGTVAQGLMKKGKAVSISSDKKYFKHLWYG